MKYIVLLRGINISGKNKILMNELKIELEKKYNNVMTYLNSGNIILEFFESKKNITNEILKIINDKFNLKIPIHILTFDELNNIFENIPSWIKMKDKEFYNNIIFIIPPENYINVYNQLGKPSENIEMVKEYNNVIFWSYNLKNYKKSNWWIKTASTSIKDSITIRTVNTMKRVLELCSENSRM